MTKSKSILSKLTSHSKPRIVPRELNFDFGQLFYPNEQKKIFEIRYFESFIKDADGNEQRVKAIVKADQTLGTLNTFDERVFYCLVEFWQEQARPIKVSFSEREIARRLKVQWGRQSAKAIDDSLNRLRTVPIQWRGSFFNAGLEQYTEIKNPFTILSHLLVESTKNRAFKAQIAEFSFDERIVANLIANHSRPVRLDVILDFRSPLAQSIYTLLERKMYKTPSYHRATRDLFYKDLGILANRYERKAIRHQELRGIRDHLLNLPTSYGEVYNRFEIDETRDVLIVGRTNSGKRRGRQPEAVIDVQATSVELSLSTPPKNPVKARKRTEVGKDTPPPSQIDSRPLSVALSGCVNEALAHFDAVFERGNRDHKQNEVLKAKAWVDQHGLDKTKFLVDFAKQESVKTSFDPLYFQGIADTYGAKALQVWEQRETEVIQQQQRAKDDEEKARLRNLDIAKCAHEDKHKEDYLTFIDDLVDRLIDEQPKEIEKFRADRKRKEALHLEKFGNPKLPKLLEIALNQYNQPMKVALDLHNFFESHPTISVPTFEEWDKAYNPNAFLYWDVVNKLS